MYSELSLLTRCRLQSKLGSVKEYGPRGRGLGTRFSYTLNCAFANTHTLLLDAWTRRYTHSSAKHTRTHTLLLDALPSTPSPLQCGSRLQEAGEATMAARGARRLDGGAWRVETMAPSSPPPVLLGCRPTSPCNASCCYRARRGGVENAGGIEPACIDAPDGAPPPWGTQRRARYRRMTTVSSTSGGFHRRRRRRRLLRGRQAAGRGTTFGAGCAAQRAASAPSPPHLHSTRARSAPSIRAARARAGPIKSPSAAPP
jgi:hypothetical protein